ncbi:MAG: galactose mutarotase [Treponema sp.]|jgi:aldose 1-epimerase|nr:MAG: galactose mutarotase [Treponema sp.]HQL32542.1 aldose epimerase family protein [Treponemataceae bacterium]
MKVKKRSFGVLSSGQKVSLYTVSNGVMSFSVTNFGCTITSICLPESNGCSGDVALGFPALHGYLHNTPYFGCLVGRFANRISGARFDLAGASHSLEANDHGNCLHSGRKGFHNQVWESDSFVNTSEAGVIFRKKSPAGDQGFPGNLDVRVTYSLSRNNEIIIRYAVKTDAPTPVNLTNHTYFNLAGHDSGSVEDHTVQLFCDRYIPVDEHAIPSGDILDVAGTPFDFRSPKAIGTDIGSVVGGYDHTWEINRAGESLNPVAGVYEPVSGRTLTVYSTQPGVQFYTGNFLDSIPGKDGCYYGKRSGFCLETQHFPDSPNRPEFPLSILIPDQRYRHETIWHFDF